MIPRPTVDSARTILSTSLSIVGMFIDVIRLRFSASALSNPALDWEWVPFETADLTDDKTIFIESGFNTNLDAYTTRPGIWIDRGQNVYKKSSIGHQDQMPVHVNARLEEFYAEGECDIIIDCTAPNRGESMVISSVVQDHLQMSSNLIQGNFGLRDMTDPILNRTIPFEKDDKLYNSQINLRVYYEARWATFPIAQLMRDAYMKLSDTTDPEKYFREITMRSTLIPEE